LTRTLVLNLSNRVKLNFDEKKKKKKNTKKKKKQKTEERSKRKQTTILKALDRDSFDKRTCIGFTINKKEELRKKKEAGRSADFTKKHH